VAEDVTQEENDLKQLVPMLDRCEEQAGRRPDEVLADAGYWSEGKPDPVPDGRGECSGQIDHRPRRGPGLDREPDLRV